MLDGSKFDSAKIGDKFTNDAGEVWLLTGIHQEGPSSYEFAQEGEDGFLIGRATHPKIDALKPLEEGLSDG